MITTLRRLPRWSLALAVTVLLGAVLYYLSHGGGGGDAGAGPRPIAVVTAVAAMLPFEDRLEAVGTLAANESITITSKVTSTVTAIRFIEGQHVPAGQVLLTVEDSEARANLAAAQAALVESHNAWQRGTEISKQGLISRSQLDQLEAKLKADQARVHAAESQLSDHTIRAPFAGRVGLRHVSIGALVNAGTEITSLDDTSTMKLDFSVPETFLAAIRAGLEIQARAAAFPELRFDGKVATVDTRIDPETRSVAVRAVLPNPKGLLKPGMFLTVQLIRERIEALILPEEALVPEQERQFVFVVEAEGDTPASVWIARKRQVHIGRRQPGIVEILDGVAPGEQVIVEGTLKVRDGAVVTLPIAADPAAGTAPAKPAKRGS